MTSDPLLNNHIVDQNEDEYEMYTKVGFRFGDKGTQTSRTIMLSELSILLNTLDKEAELQDYQCAIIEDNCLGKQTLSTRRLTTQRLKELYGLDPQIPLFRIMRYLWNFEERGRPLLALLTSLARDPILRITATPILDINTEEEMSRLRMTDVLTEALQGRLNDSTIDKVVRNASSSWTQSGHLNGRVRKIRKAVQPTPAVISYALLLGYILGNRDEGLFNTLWVKILDMPKTYLIELAIEAKRLGLIEMSQAGGVIAVSFSSLLTNKERQLIYGTN